MKLLTYYKLYDWIIEEMGASSDAVIIAVIQSFADNGIECRMSYSQFAELLRINRRNTIKRLNGLESDGYITIQGEGTQTNVYKVNRDAFKSSLIVSQKTPDSVAKDTSNSVAKDTSNSVAKDTQIKKEKKNIKKNQKESVRKRKAFTPPTLEEVKEYVSSNSLVVNPEKFYYQYEESNWKGVKNWQTRLRRWDSEDKKKSGNENSSFDIAEAKKLENNFPTDDDYDWDKILK